MMSKPIVIRSVHLTSFSNTRLTATDPEFRNFAKGFLYSILVHLKHSPPLRAGVGPAQETVTGPGWLGLVAR